MTTTAPHYLLITEAKTIVRSRETEMEPQTHFQERRGQWRFVLEQMGTDARIEVADEESHVIGERLELLAVVRGLEALEQPSRVTLLTASRYVGRGIRSGINQWREDQWRWERFGKMTPIKNYDLWQRVDQALKFHKLECRVWDFGRESSSSASRAERPEGRTRRSNVIRLQGDRVGADRQPIQPAQFHNTVSARVSTRSRFTDETAFAALDSQKQCVSGDRDIRQRTAQVKPHRAGRAYGYAVN